jgi:hypothetical protein
MQQRPPDTGKYKRRKAYIKTSKWLYGAEIRERQKKIWKREFNAGTEKKSPKIREDKMNTTTAKQRINSTKQSTF